ncbi:beta-lactamase family protein [candidate division WOR-3 bacterium]|nr:beta-lactamase family protein [candidate division WOR-3 bacterium]
MRRLLSLATILFIAAASCTYEEFERPDSNISCNMDFSSHPKDSLYQSIVDKYVNQGIAGLSVLVRDTVEGLWIGCGGYADLEDGIQMNPKHVHYISSITKSYTATEIMLLREEGLIDLDAKIDAYLPARITDKLPNGHTVTVSQLLRHTSGIPDYIDLFLVDVFNDYKKPLTAEELLEYVYKVDAWFEPGTNHSYSNTNYVLLSLIVDSLAGDHSRYLQERILDRLSLTETYYKNHPDFQWPPGLVNSYSEFYNPGRIVNLSDAQNYISANSYGDGGIRTTVEDLAEFFEALFTGEIVNQSSLDQMLTRLHDADPKLSGSDDWDYGLGIMIRNTDYGVSVGHAGGLIANQADVRYFPESEVTIVICYNVFGNFMWDLDEEFKAELFAAVFEG